MEFQVNWFEIPISEVEKSTAFYEEVFLAKSYHMDLPNIKMRIFGNADAGFALCAGIHYVPSGNGVVIYISVDDIAVILKRIQNSGGEILQPKKMISETAGYMALFKDLDGNRIALKSKN